MALLLNLAGMGDYYIFSINSDIIALPSVLRGSPETHALLAGQESV